MDALDVIQIIFSSHFHLLMFNKKVTLFNEEVTRTRTLTLTHLHTHTVSVSIPYQHPLKMVTAEVVKVQQNDSPTAEQVAEVQERVMQSIINMYNSSKKPTWETRPLVIK